MTDKQFILLMMLICPLVFLKNSKGRTIFYICGLTFYILDYLAEAVRATFGGRR